MSKYQTEQRQKLLKLFKMSDHQTLSARDILDKFNNEEISISAIYRNLKEMEKEGHICKVVEKGRSEALYQYVHPHSCVGIIHLKCENCDNTYHINRHISHMIINLANDDFNFTIKDTSAVLYGLCNTCVEQGNKLTN